MRIPSFLIHNYRRAWAIPTTPTPLPACQNSVRVLGAEMVALLFYTPRYMWCKPCIYTAHAQWNVLRSLVLPKMLSLDLGRQSGYSFIHCRDLKTESRKLTSWPTADNDRAPIRFSSSNTLIREWLIWASPLIPCIFLLNVKLLNLTWFSSGVIHSHSTTPAL